jgi:ABC-2 type transport system permease protein
MVTLVLFTVFLVVAALAGGRHTDSIAEGLQRSKQAETQRLSTLTKRLTTLTTSKAPAESNDPRDPVYMGKEGAIRVLALPPTPLAPVAVGQRDLQPQAVRVNTDVHISAERETETAMSGPTRRMTGAFDLAFLFVVLFPLVIIALSYELLSGERERGTLAMLLSQPVSQRA